MSAHEKQARIWIAASLHKRIKAAEKRTGHSMFRLANDLIRKGLERGLDCDKVKGHARSKR